MAFWHFVLVGCAVIYVIALNLFASGGIDAEAREGPISAEALHVALAFGVWLGLLIFGLAFVVVAQTLLGESFLDLDLGAALLAGFVGTAVTVVGGTAMIWFTPWLLWPIAEVIAIIVAYCLVELRLTRRMRPAA